MQKSKGFTLVELVIVIVILGILAVTAAPKFLNLAGDAKEGTLTAVEASLKSANAVIYSKAVLQGVQKTDSATVNESGTNIAVAYGYVDATEAAVSAVLDLDGGFTILQGTAVTYENGTTDVDVTAADVLIYTGAAPVAASACMLVYTKAASATAKPTFQTVNSGC